MKNRSDKTIYDIAIIGGGITGAGLLQEATKRGLKAILFDKGDFASGTSSKSSKLIHGGLRYLQYGEFKLVKEALEERASLLEHYPELVKPMPFLLPIYSFKLKYKIGMIIYQFFSRNSKMPPYESLSKVDIIKKYPSIKSKSLKGGFIYYDASTNDAQLVNTVISEAVTQGCIAKNYVEVLALSGDELKEITCQDHMKGTKEVFFAKNVINASGVWINKSTETFFSKKIKISEPSKGIHLLFENSIIELSETIFFPSFKNDGRMLFLIPWENKILYGTTDTEYSGDVNQIDSEKEDVDYLLNCINQFFPNLNLTYNNIIGTFAGLRPLIHEDSVDSKNRSREYKIWKENGILNIFGGKLTSFQSMAKHCLDEISIKNDTCIIQRLSKSALIKEIEKESDKNSELIFQTISRAEVKFYCRYQSVKTLDDLLTRRLSLTYELYQLKNKGDIILAFGSCLSEELFWIEKEKEQQITQYNLCLDKQFNFLL
jgi:glycerol-3-phosphate dehydrogenase